MLSLAQKKGKEFQYYHRLFQTQNYQIPNFIYMKNTMMINANDINVIPGYEIKFPG